MIIPVKFSEIPRCLKQIVNWDTDGREGQGSLGEFEGEWGDGEGERGRGSFRGREMERWEGEEGGREGRTREMEGVGGR